MTPADTDITNSSSVTVVLDVRFSGQVSTTTSSSIEVLRRSVETAQYGSAEFASLCRRHGIRRSMGKVGSSYDNAAAESFFASLKRELMHGARWTSRSQVRLEVFRWISFYNVRRRHSTLGYLSPFHFEQQTAASRRITLAA